MLLMAKASLFVLYSGVLARDYTHRMDEMISTVKPWVRDGTLKFEETVVNGFENLPAALGMLFTGGNIGKMLVRVESE